MLQWQLKDALRKLLKEDQLRREKLRRDDLQQEKQRVKKLKDLQQNAEDKIKKLSLAIRR